MLQRLMTTFVNTLILFFPFAVAFAFIPLDFYGQNAVEFNHDIWILHCFLGIAGLALGSIFFLSVWWKSIPQTLLTIMFSLGLIILLCDGLSPVQLGKLDGMAVSSTEPLANTLIEIGIIIGVLLFARYLLNKKSANALMATAVAALMLGCTVLYGAIMTAPVESDFHTEQAAHNSSTKQLPNIYQFHLDAMQSDFLLQALQSNSAQSAFPGFTYFTHNIANYPYTQPSVPSYLTSSIYRAGNYQTWVKEFDTGQIKDLRAAGYRVDISGIASHFYTPLAHSFTTPERIFETHYSRKHPQYSEFLSLCLARILPNPLTNKALRHGQWLGNKIGDHLNGKLEHFIPTTVDEGVHPFQAKLLFENLTQTEAAKSAHNRYTLVQAIIPHSPYVLDAECNYRQADQSDLKKIYREQVQCSILLLKNFVAELKRLGRYDNSIIIIHSDHGEGWVGFATASHSPKQDQAIYNEAITAFNRTQTNIQARTMAALMIKPADGSAPFRVSNAKSQLLDIYPTLMGMLSLPPSRPVEGLSLMACMKNPDACTAINSRPQFFYIYPHTSADAKPILQNTVIFENHKALFSSKPTVFSVNSLPLTH